MRVKDTYTQLHMADLMPQVLIFTQVTHISLRTHTFTHTHSRSHSAPSVWSVMSGVLLPLLTQGLFGWVFTASPRPSATAVRQESAGEERPLCFPRQALLRTTTLSETHAHAHRKTHTDLSYTLFTPRKANTDTPFTFPTERTHTLRHAPLLH